MNVNTRIVQSHATPSRFKHILCPNVISPRPPSFRRNLTLAAINPRITTPFRRVPVRTWPPGVAYSPYSSPSTSLSDPSRPDIFYHLVDPPTPASSSLPAFALSFLSSPPRTPDSCTIIGWLPAESSGDPSQGQEAGLNDFKENCKCLALCCHACV